MSVVMMIGPNDDPFVRAQEAITRAKAAGQLPIKWFMGKGVYARLTRDHTGATAQDEADCEPYDPE